MLDRRGFLAKQGDVFAFCFAAYVLDEDLNYRVVLQDIMVSQMIHLERIYYLRKKGNNLEDFGITQNEFIRRENDFDIKGINNG